MVQEADLNLMALVVDGKVMDIFRGTNYRKHKRLMGLKGVRVVSANASMKVGDLWEAPKGGEHEAVLPGQGVRGVRPMP